MSCAFKLKENIIIIIKIKIILFFNITHTSFIRYFNLEATALLYPLRGDSGCEIQFDLPFLYYYLPI